LFDAAATLAHDFGRTDYRICRGAILSVMGADCGASVKIDYFQAGYLAFKEGRAITDNEYTPGNLPWEEFRVGWKFAEAEENEPL
jgi:hypothetical protein